MPRDLFGIRFNDVNTTSASFHFHSDRAPIWGDCYATGFALSPPGAFNVAINTGFTPTDVDPPDPPRDGSVYQHILIPGHGGVVPDASTIVLACFGALQLLAVRKKIFR